MMSNLTTAHKSRNSPHLLFQHVLDKKEAKSLYMSEHDANGVENRRKYAGRHKSMEQLTTHLLSLSSNSSSSELQSATSSTAVATTPNVILIKGGRVVNHDKEFLGDILVEDGKIKEIGSNLASSAPGLKTIDATGKLVMPGGIDANTYLEHFAHKTRTADDFYTGTCAALAGGTTTIINFVLENNAEVSLLDAYKASKTRAESKACCDYAFHVCMRHFDERASVDMGVLANEHGVNSFKLYMNEASDAELIGFFKRCKELGALALVHAENGALIEEATKRVQALGITGPEAHLLSRPESAELEAVSRAIHTAHQLNCPLYVCSVSSRLAARQIADARRRRCSIVFAETLAACLGTDGTHYYNTCWRHAAGHVCSPPLRDEAATSGALADALANGDLDSVSSHHCTFNTNQKALGKDDWTLIPSGVNGLEERLAVTWDRGVASGKMSASQFVAATSTNAARVFNMYPRKGHIAEGSDADLVVWDPLAQRLISVETHRQAVDFNVFEGMRCVGVATHVIANGNLVLENGTLNATKGSGRFVATPCFGEHIYSRVTTRDTIKPRQIVREPYAGAVIDLSKDIESLLAIGGPTASTGEPFHHRPPTKSGGRHMQDSSFSFSGKQFDDQPIRSTTRVRNPPGGKSSGIF